MLFEELNKLRMRTIMNTIILMAIGVILIIWPEEYVKMMIDTLGSIMLIAFVVMTFDFISSKKSLMDFVWFTVALILGIAGVMTLLFDVNTVYVLGCLFGIFLVVDGVHGILHALIFARRSQRKGWWVMIPISCALAVLGVIIFRNPWWDTVGKLMKAIGWIIVFSSIVSALRLIWVWPIKSE